MNNKISIIDYGSGNFQSVYNAFQFLNCDIELVNSGQQLEYASHIVLPGVGAFGAVMEQLNTLGMIECLNKHVFMKNKYYLGICVGMQILAQKGNEFVNTPGLGVIEGQCDKINVCESGLPLPHVGWNQVSYNHRCRLFEGISNPSHFYFVHSYHLIIENKDLVVATCEYGSQVTAAVQIDNSFGVQFHPEKSQDVGLRLLQNFANL